LLANKFHNVISHSLPVNELLLLQKVSEGDWDAYTDLFNYYLPVLSQYIYPFAHQSREDTEEIIQEVFLKIWEKRETLLSIKSFDHYLFRMAKNRLTNLLIQRKSLGNLHIKYVETQERSHTEPERALLYAEYRDTALKAIEQLSPKLQTVFLMSSQEEFSLDEIAGRLALPRETVKKRLYLASSFIKNYLRTNAEWLALVAGCLFFY
jgi:RNA polymerase sigma factor (sigma-70 family)